MPEKALRFILEQPSGNGDRVRRKRARLVTACDSCRTKKIKCTLSTNPESPATICEACVQSGTPCEYSDRDRYHAERGVSLSDHGASAPAPPATAPNPSMSLNGAKRRRLSSATSSSDGLSTRSPLDPVAGPSDLASTTPPPYDVPTSSIENSTISKNYAPVPTPSTIGISPTTSTGPLQRIIVPFFRYFGPTANTPGYRRIKVRALTLSEDPASTRDGVEDKSQNGLPGTLNGHISSLLTNPHHHNSYFDDAANRIPPFHYADTSAPRFSTQLNGHSKLQSPPSPTSVNRPDQRQQQQQPLTDENLFDPARPRYPNPIHLSHLTKLFFDNLACHFPFLDRARIMQQAEEGSLSSVLANCIAGLAIRFSDREEIVSSDRPSSGEPYCDMAKLLIVHLLSWPSLEVLQALVLIAWGEFGAGRDSGLWMYSRMAVAMAIDLGLQTEATIQLTSGVEERERVRLTWWAVVLVDRINSWGTGRPLAIADNQFDTALPTSDVSVGADLDQPPPPSFVYGHLCRLVQLRGKLGDVLNNQAVKAKDPSEPAGMELSELQSHMTFFYQSLPPSLLFTMQNFKRFSRHEQAATFILLHVMFHSVITLLHRPGLLQGFTPSVDLPLASNVDLSRSSARSIVDMVLLAKEFDPKALISNPFLDLPLLTAARAFLAERESAPRPGASVYPQWLLVRLQWSEKGVEQCHDVLETMSAYWGGVACVKRILEQQSSGRLDFDVGEGAQPDSRIDELRDVELIKQWATSAWRRQRPSGATTPTKARSQRPSPRPSVPLLPVDHNNMQHGSAAHLPEPQTDSNSPADAAIGITGFLDGPMFDSSAQPVDWSLDPSGGQDAFRILFNPAEADLSFDNLSRELFSIPEGFEEFLASQASSFNPPQTATDIPGQSLVSPHLPNGSQLSSAAAGLEALGQAAAAEQIQQSGVRRASFVEQPATQFPDYFPVFSSLSLPVPQSLQSRASSPAL
ncbi:hypothetical protein DL93DRAFT_2073204 [Clavulina sp. PMI_390]|nr:hypothetical protein DL93DRAFT_2073204 [Clavulina sp. PMI_390]